MRWRNGLILLAVVGAACLRPPLQAEDGYRLWLRYDACDDARYVTEASAALRTIVFATPRGADTPTLEVARDELKRGLGGLCGFAPAFEMTAPPATPAPGAEGYVFRLTGGRCEIAAQTDIGVLYGAFALLRHVQLRQPPGLLDGRASAPRIQRRLLNHWDNLNRFVERGYAGFSLWEWFNLPEYRNPRYRDYARAMASVGLNGTVLTNVNANALILTPDYLARCAALAEEFRPYGVRVYLAARFSAPIELGKLPTADPLDPAVIAWWRAKVDEIYRYVPDFGGFVVKANSEGQPGPQDYGRSHADGANMLAEAVAARGGIVMWRAFVYQSQSDEDRVKQAHTEFMPLDGKFRANVAVQIKNGPLDFMPREPFHPLFGGLKRTPLALELQITQEYFGGATQVAYLGTMWKETLDADTFSRGPGSTVARTVDGTLHRQPLSVMAGVSNIGTDRNWTGHPLAQANWYAFGRLAWDHALGAEAIADEWTRLTFGSDPATVRTITGILMRSRQAVVNYSMPLGLHHIMAAGHHYGPGPWVDRGRADWRSTYYHRADAEGLGVDRGPGGSNALEQYAPELAQRWGDLATVPEELLLWFHHVPWQHQLKSGRTLWEELCVRYQRGVDEVRAMQREWETLAGRIDDERHAHVRALLRRQESDAREWRDACILYFQTFSQIPVPAGVEEAAHDLDYYKAINRRFVPGNPGDR